MCFKASEKTSSPVPKHDPAKTKLYIHIEDKNDNAPIFDRKMYLAEVYEDAAIGTIITWATAIDKDVVSEHILYFSWFG